MNVLHVDEQGGWRGGEQQASWLIRGLAERGHSISLAGRQGGAFLASDHGGVPSKRIEVPLLGEWDLWSARLLAGVVRRESIDIIHAHTSHAHTMACIARRMAGRSKVVVSRRVSFEPKSNPFNRWKYAWPDAIIAVSTSVANVLLDFGVSVNRVEVVYSAVDLERMEVKALTRKELGIKEGALLLVSAGALVGHKDHATLVAAVPQIREAFPDLRLLIAGEGELEPQIARQIESLNLGDTVTLLGHREDVPQLIRACDRYVSSSWSEGLGTSVLEALACKAPVVATEAGGVGEMVLEGETGYLVPNRDPKALAEAVIESLRKVDRAREMAENGRRLVESKFSVEAMIEGTLRVYERLLVEG